jgi:hypothetical protein
MKSSFKHLRNFSLLIISLSLTILSCSKNGDSVAPANTANYAGNYVVVDDDETYTLQIENKGGNNFQIREFGGFLNAALKAVANGSTLTIPTQTFTNPNGNSITITGTGNLTTKDSKDDTITFEYTLSGFGAHTGSFQGVRN